MREGARQPLPPGDRIPSRRRTALQGGLLAVALLLVAVAARWPYLWSFPVFSVEWEEISRGAAILYQGLRPATDYAQDIGPIFNYAVAGTLHLTGGDLHAPRLISLGAGALLAPIAYAVGAEVSGRRAGVLAGLVVASCGAAIILSHEAFSDTLTPLLAAAAGLFAIYGERRSPWWIVPAGFLWALAAQTDSSAFSVVIPGAAALLYRGRAERRALQLVLGGCAFLLGYANMIVLNIQKPLISLHWILQRKTYAIGQQHGPLTVLSHYVMEAEAWGQTLGSSFLATPAGAGDAWGAAAALLWLAAFVLAVRSHLRGRTSSVLLALTVGPLLLIPLINQDYAYPLASRYLVPLLPFAAALVAAWVVRLADRWKARPGRQAVLAVAVAAFAVVGPLVSTTGYMAAQTWDARVNAAGFALAAAVKREGTTRLPVYFDSTALKAQYYPDMLRSEGLTVNLMGDPWAHGEKGVFSPGQWTGLLTAPHPPLLLVLSGTTYPKLAPLIPSSTQVARIAAPGSGYVVILVPSRGQPPAPAKR